MSRERILSITFMAIGGVLVLAGAVYMLFFFKAARVPEDESPDYSMFAAGSIFIGLTVGAVGASTYE